MTAEEERCWTYLLKNRNASAQDLAINCDVTEAYAVDLMARISSLNWRSEYKVEEGTKYDGEKARYDLVPPEVEEAIAQILTFGAGKYGDRNWEKGMSWGRAYAAMRRHMNAWWAGEDNDPETGMPHTWHAACCIAFLISYQSRGIGKDDRNKLKVITHANLAPKEGTGTQVA